MHAQQWVSSVKDTDIAPIYLLYGEESYFIQQVIGQIEDLLKKKYEDFDKNTYDMESTVVQEAIHDAETFPMFTEHKLTIINRASFLTGQAKKEELDHQVEVLQDFVEHPVEFSTTVIIAPYEKLDQRKKIVKVLKNKCTTIDCSPPKVQDMQSMITYLAKDKGLDLSGSVIELLLERVGEHLDALDHELEKLALYFENDHVTYEGAEELISVHAETSSFTLMDAIVELQLGKALQILKELKKQNEEPIALLALLTSQIRLLLLCKLLKEKGYQQQQMAKQIKSHPYAIKMALKRERRLSESVLKEMIHSAIKVDEFMKSGKMDKWLALEMFVRDMSQHIQERKYN
ncbi:DNA polymerase III subunit delta [Halalkalibacillus sediminis]|uniref:DNA polymerase III subunit delta n=1 Tax=Halalkalibacillus sediminis TaxID=2018042 RepID=UPI00138FD1C0|nr:DNA polymerase III subunit delta [Halalkalibacillus sediminis]